MSEILIQNEQRMFYLQMFSIKDKIVTINSHEINRYNFVHHNNLLRKREE